MVILKSIVCLANTWESGGRVPCCLGSLGGPWPIKLSLIYSTIYIQSIRGGGDRIIAPFTLFGPCCSLYAHSLNHCSINPRGADYIGCLLEVTKSLKVLKWVIGWLAGHQWYSILILSCSIWCSALYPAEQVKRIYIYVIITFACVKSVLRGAFAYP